MNVTTSTYTQVVTFPIDFFPNFSSFEIAYNVLVKGELANLVLYLGDPIEPEPKITITPKAIIQFELNAITSKIQDAFNKLFFTQKGVSFANLLFKTPLCWLDIN